LRKLADLWAGRLPLAEAFWTHAVLIGLTVNIAATVASMGAIAAGLSSALALAVHLSPLPYTLACATGVWRSAARHTGPHFWPDMARFAVLVWSAFLVVV